MQQSHAMRLLPKTLHSASDAPELRNLHTIRDESGAVIVAL